MRDAKKIDSACSQCCQFVTPICKAFHPCSTGFIKWPVQCKPIVPFTFCRMIVHSVLFSLKGRGQIWKGHIGTISICIIVQEFIQRHAHLDAFTLYSHKDSTFLLPTKLSISDWHSFNRAMSIFITRYSKLKLTHVLNIVYTLIPWWVTMDDDVMGYNTNIGR